MVVEVTFNELMDYWFDKYKEVISDNERLRITMKHQLDKINEQRGKLTDLEHKFDEVLEREQQSKKENERLWETIEGLHKKIDELKGENNDSD